MTLSLVGLGGTFAFWRLSSAFESQATFAVVEAWEVADGIMEISIDVQSEMLLVNEIVTSGSRPDLKAHIQVISERIAEDQERVSQHRQGFDPTLKERLAKGFSSYAESLDAFLKVHEAYDAARSAFTVHGERFHSLITTMEEYGDFNLESSVVGESSSEEQLNMWTAADGTMHILIGLLRQFYYVNRYLSGDSSQEMLPAIERAKEFQELAASRVISSGAMEVFTLGDFQEKDLAAAYQENYALHVKLLESVLERYTRMQQALARFKEASKNLLADLQKAEAVADAGVENLRSPLSRLSSMSSMGFMGTMALLVAMSIFVWRKLRNTVVAPSASLANYANSLRNGEEANIQMGPGASKDLEETGVILATVHNERERQFRDCEANRELLQGVVDGLPDIALTTDADLRVQFATPSFERLLGYRSHEWRSMSLDRLVTGESMRVLQEVRDRAEACLNDPTQERDGGPFQLEVLACDERALFVECTSNTLCGDDGHFKGLTLSMRDMSSIRDQREERSLLHAAINQASEGVLIVEGASRALFANESFVTLFDMCKDEFLRRLSSPPEHEEGDVFRTLGVAIGAGEPWQGRVSLYQGKSTKYLDVQVTPVRGVVSAEPIALVFVWDMTPAVQTEKDLREAQKMHAIGSLAGGIAHDFNNLLVPILMHAELLALSGDACGADDPRLREIITAATRAKELVRQVLTFSRGADPALSRIRLDKVVEEAAMLCRGSLPPDVRSELKLRSQRTILGNRTQLVQVVINLCTNAKSAMAEGGGVLTVEVDEVRQKLHGDDEERDFVRLRMQDTGRGIPEDQLERVYEPFYTTGEPEENTGLGLAIVHAIIKSNGGRIHLQSRPNHGTTVTILFPALDAPEDVIVAQKHIPDKRETFSGKVLLVDDEPGNLTAISTFLQYIGMEVVASLDPREAHHIVSQEPEGFAAAICDVAMPHISGLDLAKRLQAISPALPVLLITGKPDDIVSQLEGMKHVAYLAKPFDLDEMTEGLQRLLSASE